PACVSVCCRRPVCVWNRLPQSRQNTAMSEPRTTNIHTEEHYHRAGKTQPCRNLEPHTHTHILPFTCTLWAPVELSGRLGRPVEAHRKQMAKEMNTHSTPVGLPLRERRTWRGNGAVVSQDPRLCLQVRMRDLICLF